MSPGVAIPKIDVNLAHPADLKCNLVGGYIGLAPGRPSLWQFVAEFKSQKSGDGTPYRDLVVFESNEKDLRSWRIVKFM